MHKLLDIAGREYKAAVRTKAFVISLVLVPILWAASIGIQVLVHKAEDRSYQEIRRRRPHAGPAGDWPHSRPPCSFTTTFGFTTARRTSRPSRSSRSMPIEPSAPDEESILEQRLRPVAAVPELANSRAFWKSARTSIGSAHGPERTTTPGGSCGSSRPSPAAGGFSRWAKEAATAGIQQHRFAEHNVSAGPGSRNCNNRCI